MYKVQTNFLQAEHDTGIFFFSKKETKKQSLKPSKQERGKHTMKHRKTAGGRKRTKNKQRGRKINTEKNYRHKSGRGRQKQTR